MGTREKKTEPNEPMKAKTKEYRSLPDRATTPIGGQTQGFFRSRFLSA